MLRIHEHASPWLNHLGSRQNIFYENSSHLVFWLKYGYLLINMQITVNE